MQGYRKVNSKKAPEVFMKVIPGHFVTPNSHINYYIDMTTMKSRLSEAQNAAKALAEDYLASTIVDSIVCMDGCEVIGAFLADELTKDGILTIQPKPRPDELEAFLAELQSMPQTEEFLLPRDDAPGPSPFEGWEP